MPTLALAGQWSEPRSLYQRPDGEWFLCKGLVCDQPVPPPSWAPLPDRQQHQRGDRDQDLAMSGKGPTAKLDQLGNRIRADQRPGIEAAPANKVSKVENAAPAAASSPTPRFREARLPGVLG